MDGRRVISRGGRDKHRFAEKVPTALILCIGIPQGGMI